MSETLLYIFPPPPPPRASVLGGTGVSLSTAETAVLLVLVAFVAKYACRLFFSPLSSFPGPRFAAATKLYEAYHVLVRNDWLENLEGLHRQYGPVVRIGPNELHFTDHEFCLQHHKRSDLSKCRNYYGLLGNLVGGLSSPQAHAVRKAAVQPLFTGSNLAQFSHTTLNDQLDSLYGRLRHDASTSGGLLNMTHYLWAYTNDVMMAYIFGRDPGFLKHPDVVQVHDSMRAFSAIDLATILRSMPIFKTLLDSFPFLRTLSPLGWLDKLVNTHLRDIFATNAKLLPSQKTALKPTPSVLESMWQQLSTEPTALVTQEAAQAIFIGNESLLSNLTFLLHHMMANPATIRRLRTEMDELLQIGFYGHRVWADPKVLQLPYLDALCRESTRLSSPSWHRQPRCVAEAVEYKGTVVPPMTSMSFTLRMLERDPILYPNPDSFQPERWLGLGPEAKQARQNSVTFGAGTRTCLGQYLARVVLRKTLAAIVYNFDISLWDEPRDRVEGYRYLDTYPKKGHEGYLRIKLTPRFAPLE